MLTKILKKGPGQQWSTDAVAPVAFWKLVQKNLKLWAKSPTLASFT